MNTTTNDRTDAGGANKYPRPIPAPLEIKAFVESGS
jgi:hypothetical protein